MKKTFVILCSILSVLSAEVTIVKDDSRKLLWEDTLHVEDIKITHIKAKEYCSELTLGGYNHWRLPTLTELLTIVDYTKYKPALLKEFEHVNKDTIYWTSTPYVRSSDEYWGVNFKDGATSNATETYDRYVRCVKDI